MAIALTLFVRDEAELIASNVRHHLEQGIDHVYVCDNGSTDDTVGELEPFRRRRLVTVEHDPEHRVQQGEAMTRLAHRAWEDGAAWVLHADADEFLFAREGTIRTALVGVPDEVDVLLVRRYNLVHRPATAGPWHAVMDVRLADDVHLPGIGEGRLAPKVAHRARPGVQVAQGAHAVHHEALGAPVDDGRLEALHAPLRDPLGFERRVRIHGEAYERSRLPDGVGHVRRSLYASLVDGTLGDRIAAATYDDGRIEEGLRSGALVRDRRFVESLAHRGSRPARRSLRDRWRALTAGGGGADRAADAGGGRR